MERQPEGKQRLAGRAATEPGQDPEAGRPNARPATPPGLGPIARAGSQADLQALLRIFERCHVWIDAASKASSVPPAFLGALTANESAALSPLSIAISRQLRAARLRLTEALGPAIWIRQSRTGFTPKRPSTTHATSLAPLARATAPPSAPSRTTSCASSPLPGDSRRSWATT